MLLSDVMPNDDIVCRPMVIAASTECVKAFQSIPQDFSYTTLMAWLCATVAAAGVLLVRRPIAAASASVGGEI